MDQFVSQGALTIVCPISKQVDDLKKILAQIDRDLDEEKKSSFPFVDIPSIHFARFVVVEESLTESGQLRKIVPFLMFSTNYDGKESEQLRDIVQIGGEGLDQVLGYCKGYPKEETSKEKILYLKKHRNPYGAFHVGVQGITVGRIRREAKLRDAINDFIDEKQEAGDWDKWNDSLGVRDSIKHYVGRTGDLRWAIQKPKGPSLAWKLFRRTGWKIALPITLFLLSLLTANVYFGMKLLADAFIPLIMLVTLLAWKLSRITGWKIAFSITLFLLSLLTAIVYTGVRLPAGDYLPLIILVTFLTLLSLVFLILWLILREKEKTDKEFPHLRYDEHAKIMAEREDRVVQNQMSLLVDIKPGWFRTFALKAVFVVIELLARYLFTKGDLGGIPTIHFARWVIVEKGKSLMFMSNYGSSWESYLGDFIDKASEGLNAVWSNTVLYPRTKNLIKEGSRDEERFKCWVRAQQIKTNVWYTAYGHLTVKNIIQNRKIREGIAKKRMTKQEVVEWLKLF